MQEGGHEVNASDATVHLSGPRRVTRGQRLGCNDTIQRIEVPQRQLYLCRARRLATQCQGKKKEHRMDRVYVMLWLLHVEQPAHQSVPSTSLIQVTPLPPVSPHLVIPSCLRLPRCPRIQPPSSHSGNQITVLVNPALCDHLRHDRCWRRRIQALKN